MDIRLMVAVPFVDLTAPEDVLCRTIFCLHVRPHHADVRFNFLSFNMSDPAPDIQRIYSVCVCCRLPRIRGRTPQLARRRTG